MSLLKTKHLSPLDFTIVKLLAEVFLKVDVPEILEKSLKNACKRG